MCIYAFSLLYIYIYNHVTVLVRYFTFISMKCNLFTHPLLLNTIIDILLNICKGSDLSLYSLPTMPMLREVETE